MNRATDTVYEEGVAEAALARADPALGRAIAAVVAKIGPQRIKPSRSPLFEALVRAIVYQSISGKAAAAIFAQLKESLGRSLRPAGVQTQPLSALRGAGLSGAKSRAIQNLAQWFQANRKQARALSNLPNEEVVAALTDIPGIGLWTVNVFLIFSLGRPDVLPASDQGIRRGVQLICGLKSTATAAQVLERAQRWRPHRSTASIYLWNAVKLKITPSDLRKRRPS